MILVKKHALLSASSAHKWLENPPISRLEEIAEEELNVNDSNEYAEEGTAAHDLGEYYLRTALGEKVEMPNSDYHTDEMHEYTKDYSLFIQELMNESDLPTQVLIEQRLDFSKWVPEGFGTGDCVLIKDKSIHVIDFKYGRYFVQAENNPQMMLYALGAIDMYDGIYDIEEVYMTIYQPRINNISTWLIDKDALLEWADGELKEKAQLAYEGKGDFNPGSWLRLTKLKAVSKDRAEHHLKLRKYQLKEAHLLSDHEIEEILAHVDDLVDWAKSVKDYAEDQAVRYGKVWNGFKVVEGRTRRKYSSEEEIKIRAEDHNVDVYEQKLLPITKLEKSIGKKRFEELFGDLVIKPSGKPTLVAESDSRLAIVKIDAQTEFKKVKGDK